MSLILSIETATKVCSVALHTKAQLIVTQTLYVEKSHAESLLHTIEYLLAASPYTKKDLTAIAISSGPGSYTGLRIGAATAKGLCYALGLPLISINTLEAMAYGMYPYNTSQARLCPMLDARRMEVYYLLAAPQGHMLVEPQVMFVRADSFQDWLAKGPVLFFGEGAAKCRSLWSRHTHALFIENIYPEAHHVGLLAYVKFQQAFFEDLIHFSPLYLKPFQ